MITGPKLEDRSEQRYLGIRTQIPLQELGPSNVVPRLHSEVMDWMRKNGVKPSGDPFIRYHVINMEDQLDIEMGWPVANGATGNDRVKAGVIPAGKYASLLYTGPYDGLMAANGVLINWAKEQGIDWDRWDDPNGDAFKSRFETYIKDPGNEPDPAKWETEVAIKVAEK